MDVILKLVNRPGYCPIKHINRYYLKKTTTAKKSCKKYYVKYYIIRLCTIFSKIVLQYLRNVTAVCSILYCNNFVDLATCRLTYALQTPGVTSSVYIYESLKNDLFFFVKVILEPVTCFLRDHYAFSEKIYISIR